jgi:hypothetical protein
MAHGLKVWMDRDGPRSYQQPRDGRRKHCSAQYVSGKGAMIDESEVWQRQQETASQGYLSSLERGNK